MGAQRRTARRDVACNVSDVAMLRLYQISSPSLTVLTNNPTLYSAVSATSAVRARFDSGILGHVLGHLLVDSKGLVPESRNSHIVLWTLRSLCPLWFRRVVAVGVGFSLVARS